MLYIKEKELKTLWRQCRQGWYWFALAFVGCMALAAAFIFIKSPKFEVYTSLRIVGGSKGGSLMASMAKNSGFGDILGMGGTEVDNELTIIQSHHVLYNAVKACGYNVNYSSRPVLKRQTYWKDAPIELRPVSPIYGDTLGEFLKWKISLNADGTKADIYCKTTDHGVVCDLEDVALPAQFSTGWGEFTLATTPALQTAKTRTFRCTVASYTAAAQSLMEEMIFKLTDKKADIIEISAKDVRPDRMADLLNAIVQSYDTYNAQAKNLSTGISSDLLQQRIDTVAAELSDIEARIETYKKSHDIALPEEEVKQAIKQAVELKQQLIELEVQKSSVAMLIQYINDPQHQYEPLPAVSGMGGSKESSPISEYNDAIIRYQQLSQTAYGNNPTLQQARRAIDTQRQAALLTLQNMQRTVEHGIREAQREQDKLLSLKSSTPELEREYIELMRQQELKQKIFVLLKAQQEQNALTINQDTPHGQQVDEAWVNVLPSGPKPVVIILVALIFALFLPLAWLRILEAYKATISSPEDIRRLKGFTGDIYIMDGDTEDVRQLAFALHGNVTMLSMRGDAETGDLAETLKPHLDAETHLTVTPAFVDKADAMYALPKSDMQLLVVRQDVSRKSDRDYVETLMHRNLLKQLVVAYCRK